MKTKKIIKKLENLFGKSEEQKTNDRQLELVTELIGLLEEKETKFQAKLEALEAESDIPKYKNKLSLTELHLSKARAYKQQLESQ
jgi:hypothetical protein